VRGRSRCGRTGSRVSDTKNARSRDRLSAFGRNTSVSLGCGAALGPPKSNCPRSRWDARKPCKADFTACRPRMPLITTRLVGETVVSYTRRPTPAVTRDRSRLSRWSRGTRARVRDDVRASAQGRPRASEALRLENVSRETPPPRPARFRFGRRRLGRPQPPGHRVAGPSRGRSMARHSTLPILRTAAIRRALSSSTKRAKSAASW
jgi:hypothetical protein